MTRIKPFPYDAIETSDAVLFAFGYQGADGRPAESLLAPNGIQITRADQMVIRIGNLHPRLRDAASKKQTFIVEVAGASSVIYPSNPSAEPVRGIAALLPSTFYWYFGPETSTVRELAERPFANLVACAIGRPVAVAPGDTGSGPLLGLCLSKPGILPLAQNRAWARASNGLIVDTGLARGCTTGYSSTDDIDRSVSDAHLDCSPPPQFRPRSTWQSQVAVAFPASTDT